MLNTTEYKPTESELEILQVLWQQGPQTVRQVNETLNLRKQAETGYTTTLKLMQIMADKGLVSRLLDGKTHIYRAAVEETQTQQALISRMLETAFGGSAMKLVLQALGGQKASAEEIRQIRAMLDSMEQGGKV